MTKYIKFKVCPKLMLQLDIILHLNVLPFGKHLPHLFFFHGLLHISTLAAKQLVLTRAIDTKQWRRLTVHRQSLYYRHMTGN